ncbi:MAG: PDDEXK nuclease domain-containing protein [Proteobacteria bacterium]|nr:PDDEXK nuclease domain-containing protein [Pseudomonadota bacterium]
MNNNEILDQDYSILITDLKKRVAESRYKATLSVNKEMVLLYHHIGQQILKSQKEQGWGSKVIEKLSKDLRSAFPEMKGLSTRNLKYMRKFAAEYKNFEFVQEVLAQLSWYHNITLIDKVLDRKEREFYIQKAIQNGWSRNIMVIQVETNLYKRQGGAVTNFDARLSNSQSDLAKELIKDPYIFDFLSIGESAHEREIEKGLITHIEKFLIELGTGFAFLGRQYHIEVSKKDYYIDLLFYHVKLKSYIVVELKSKEFKPEYAGKMSFYLSAVDKTLKQKDDNPSIGLILCKTKDKILAEYTLQGTVKPIGISEYKLLEELPRKIKSTLPSIEELEKELSKDIKKINEDEENE